MSLRSHKHSLFKDRSYSGRTHSVALASKLHTEADRAAWERLGMEAAEESVANQRTPRLEAAG